MAISNRYVRPVALCLRVALGAVFVYAAYVKLFQFADGRLHLLPWQLFAMAIDSYQLLPQFAVEFLARTLPWFELALGLLLITGRWLRWAGAATSLLLMVFMGLMIRAYVKGQEISCGCFGAGDIISWKTLLRDGSLLALSLIVTASAFWKGDAPRPAADDNAPTPQSPATSSE